MRVVDGVEQRADWQHCDYCRTSFARYEDGTLYASCQCGECVRSPDEKAMSTDIQKLLKDAADLVFRTEHPVVIDDIYVQGRIARLSLTEMLTAAYEAGRMAGKRELIAAAARPRGGDDYSIMRISAAADGGIVWHHMWTQDTGHGLVRCAKTGETVDSLIEYLDAQEAGE